MDNPLLGAAVEAPLAIGCVGLERLTCLEGATLLSRIGFFARFGGGVELIAAGGFQRVAGRAVGGFGFSTIGTGLEGDRGAKGLPTPIFFTISSTTARDPTGSRATADPTERKKTKERTTRILRAQQVHLHAGTTIKSFPKAQQCNKISLIQYTYSQILGQYRMMLTTYSKIIGNPRTVKSKLRQRKVPCRQ